MARPAGGYRTGRSDLYVGGVESKRERSVATSQTAQSVRLRGNSWLRYGDPAINRAQSLS